MGTKRIQTDSRHDPERCAFFVMFNAYPKQGERYADAPRHVLCRNEEGVFFWATLSPARTLTMQDDLYANRPLYLHRIENRDELRDWLNRHADTILEAWGEPEPSSGG